MSRLISTGRATTRIRAALLAVRLIPPTRLPAGKIEADGDAWFANIEATSLTIKTFVADVTLALAGSDIITKSRAIVSRDFTTPSVSGTLYVHDLPGQPNTAVFESGDFLCGLRYVQRSTGLSRGRRVGHSIQLYGLGRHGAIVDVHAHLGPAPGR